MTTPDLDAVRSAESRVRDVLKGAWRQGVYPEACDAVDDKCLFDRDVFVIASGYLAEHDPTPLTVEVLVGMGFVKDGDWFTRGKIRVGWTNREVQFWAWYELLPEDERSRIWPSPCTSGELWQLILRFKESPHAAR